MRANSFLKTWRGKALRCPVVLWHYEIVSDNLNLMNDKVAVQIIVLCICVTVVFVIVQYAFYRCVDDKALEYLIPSSALSYLWGGEVAAKKIKRGLPINYNTLRMKHLLYWHRQE